MLNIDNKIPKKIIRKFKDKKNDPQHLEHMKEFLTNSIQKMKVKQEKLMKKYDFAKKDNKFVLHPEKNTFYMLNSKTNKVFFKAKIQIIGTYADKSRTWRWGWSNRFVPSDLEKTALKIKKFGEANKMEILSKPRIRDENLGLNFVALGMELTNSPGFFIIPGTKTYPHVYLIFTKVQKVELDYTELVSQMKTDNRKNTQVLKKKFKKTIKIIKPPSKDKIAKKESIKKTKKKTPSLKSVNKKKTPINSLPGKLIKVLRVKEPKKKSLYQSSLNALKSLPKSLLQKN